MTTAAEALVRDCANRLDQLFRQDYTMREVEAELRRLLRATQSNLKGGDAVNAGALDTADHSIDSDAVTGAAHPSPRGEPIAEVIGFAGGLGREPVFLPRKDAPIGTKLYAAPQPSAVHDAYVAMCALLYPYQRNGETELDALRRLVAPAQEHVAWLRYVRAHDRPTRIQLCDSDTPGAFKVYAAQPHDEAVALLRALEPHLDKLICYASTPDEYEPNAIVARIRAFLKDRT